MQKLKLDKVRGTFCHIDNLSVLKNNNNDDNNENFLTEAYFFLFFSRCAFMIWETRKNVVFIIFLFYYNCIA